MGRKHLYPPSVRHGIPHLGRLPRGWIKTTFGEQLRVVERPVELRPEASYQLVTAKRNRGGIVARETLRGDQILTAGQFQVAAGDFITSNRQIIHGACGIVPRALDGAVVSGEYTVMHARSGLHLPFFEHYTHGDYFQKSCFFASVGVDVEKMLFDVERWLNLPFHLPPIDEQRAITRTLDDLDAAAHYTKLAGEQAHRLLAEVFHKVQSSTKTTETKLGEICSFEYGESLVGDLRSENGFPVIGSGGVVAFSSKKLVDGPGIIVGRKGSVGEIYWASEDFWPIDTTYYAVPKRTLSLRWLFWALTYSNAKRLGSATGVPGLSRDDAYNIRIQLPAEPDQVKIAKCLDLIERQKSLENQTLDQLRRAKDIIGDRFFSGNIRSRI